MTRTRASRRSSTKRKTSSRTVSLTVLGIDPGTQCGWAVLAQDGARIASGVWDMQARRFEGGGMRYLRLRRYLLEVLHDVQGIQAVAIEEVRRHKGTDAAHVYGGIVSIITAECEDKKLPWTGIPVGTVKKLATGSGNASKEAMIEAAQKRWEHEPEDDNEADALWVAATLQNDFV